MFFFLFYYTYPQTDLRKLLQTSHFINGKAISVERLPPKEKLPPDPFRLYVRGLNEKTTEDCLLFYLEKFSDVEVKEVIRGCDGKALAIFAVEPGNEWKVFFPINYFTYRPAKHQLQFMNLYNHLENSSKKARALIG